jgi:dihydropteroate synthase
MKFAPPADRPAIMGVLNVTPDSFSDGGKYINAEKAMLRAREMVADGADLIDVGAESTRPGAEPVTEEEELRRLKGVLFALQEERLTFSIDTSKPKVAELALEMGAAMVNDVRALQTEGMLDLVAEAECAVCLMHMQGDPLTMQENPQYADVIGDIREFLHGRVNAAQEAGIDKNRIWLDPGIGFGKAFTHNLRVLKHLDKIVEMGYPVLVGASRKGFIGWLVNEVQPPEPEHRAPGTIAAHTLAQVAGAKMLRVHDVPEAVQAVKVAAGILNFQ